MEFNQKPIEELKNTQDMEMSATSDQDLEQLDNHDNHEKQ